MSKKRLPLLRLDSGPMRPQRRPLIKRPLSSSINSLLTLVELIPPAWSDNSGSVKTFPWHRFLLTYERMCGTWLIRREWRQGRAGECVCVWKAA